MTRERDTCRVKIFPICGLFLTESFWRGGKIWSHGRIGLERRHTSMKLQNMNQWTLMMKLILRLPNIFTENIMSPTRKHTASSIVFYEPGKAKLEETITQNDVYEHSFKHSSGRWGVLIKPLVVGLCPTDQAGGNRDFPPGSTRSFDNSKNPAVAGHEFVGEIIEANEPSLKGLS